MIEKNEVYDILRRIVTDGVIKPTSKGFNFRCPVCGDSQKNKSKKRGWVLFDNQKVTYMCHNGGCIDPISFQRLVKEKFPHFYDEYFKTDLNKLDLKKKKDYDFEVKIVEKGIDIDEISGQIIPDSFSILEKNVTGITNSKLQMNEKRGNH